ncbi:BAR adaptor protein Hob3 [Hesseltinella vesiculosa]|uniref:BAR adaptor protein Hob3 n=1 Tax=Hesseltinella vesiculosa TaxID=101127 RepID=A0A1X2GNA8_9FUNG|nr:BAR adaptor protein Hob3 [Hesseltinella vesiculosa]
MSFLTGFKKNLNRAGQSIMQKTGMVDKTVDDDFSEEYERFKLLEQKMEKLTRHAKDYQNAMRGVGASQMMIMQTMEQFYETEDANFAIYKQTMQRLDAAYKTGVDEVYTETVMAPLAKYCSYFPQVNEAIKRRQKKLLDYDTQRAKVHKLVERSASGYDSSVSNSNGLRRSDLPSEPTGMDKLSQAEQMANVAREMYESVNTVLINDLPQIISLRVPYLDPTFEALVKSQLTYNQLAFDHLSSMQNVFPQDEQDQQARVEDILQQMRSLTICGNV